MLTDRKKLFELVVDSMAPPNTRSQGKTPGKARQPRPIRSKGSDDTKPTNVLPNTPRRIFREYDAPSDDPSITSLTALETQFVDSGFDDWHGYGENPQIGAYDDASSSSSGVTHNSTENIHPSSSLFGDMVYVKKRRRLSVRPGVGEPSTNVLSDSASSQDIDSGFDQETMANLFNLPHHSQLPRYTDAQVQTSPSGRSSPGVEEEYSPLHQLISEGFENHRPKELNDIIRQHGPRFAKTTKEKKPAHTISTIPGTCYQMPPDWDPPSPPVNPLAHGDKGWPPVVVPVEIFEHVGSCLSRDDLLSMRLVNHEFEAKISSRVFQTVVVPFKSDIYGVADNDAVEIGSTANNAGPDRRKAKGMCLLAFFACSY